MKTGINLKLLESCQAKGIKAIAVTGLLWFAKNDGNTYNSYEIQVLDNGTWKVLAIGEYSYGYGEQYFQRASELMKMLGFTFDAPFWFRTKHHVTKEELHKIPKSFVDVVELVGADNESLSKIT